LTHSRHARRGWGLCATRRVPSACAPPPPAEALSLFSEASMSPVLEGLDWTGLARLIFICAGAILIAVRLIDRLFPAQQRGPAATARQAEEHSGEGGARSNPNDSIAQPPVRPTLAATIP